MVLICVQMAYVQSRLYFFVICFETWFPSIHYILKWGQGLDISLNSYFIHIITLGMVCEEGMDQYRL